MGLKLDGEAGNMPLSESDIFPLALSLPYCCTFLYFSIAAVCICMSFTVSQSNYRFEILMCCVFMYKYDSQ